MNAADPTPVGNIRPIAAGQRAEPDRRTGHGSGPDHSRRDPGHGQQRLTATGEAGGGTGARSGRQPGQRRPRWLWRVTVGVMVVVLLLVGYFAVSLYQVWATGRSNQARAVDAIVVLGAAQYDGTPSPQLAGRLDHVVRLWPQGYAPLVITTGGNQPGDRFTEAEASARYLIERGIPSDAILLEDRGTTTYESLEAVGEMLSEQGLESVLLVTDPYHSLRSRLIAQHHGLTAYVSPTTSSVVGSRSAWKHNVQEAAGVMAGRIIGFGRF